MLRHLFAATHPTGYVHQARHSELRHGIHEPRSTDTLRRDVATDHLQLDPIGEDDTLDSSLGRPHPALDLTALEGGTRGGGGGQHTGG